MKTIRLNTFETNSSSTHCMTLMNDEEYNKLDGLNYYFEEGNNQAVSIEDIFKKFNSYIDCETMPDNMFDLFKEVVHYCANQDDHYNSEVDDFIDESDKEYTDEEKEWIATIIEWFQDREYYSLEYYPANDWHEENISNDYTVDGVKIHVIGWYGRG